jgi:acetyl-CoA C-acetyltransferase
MSIRGRAFIVGAYEHPGRRLPDRSTPQIFRDVATGALADAGLSLGDIDAVFCDSNIGGLSSLSISEYLGVRSRYMDSTDIGGSSYLSHIGHASAAIAAGKCHVALVMLAGKSGSQVPAPELPESSFESTYGPTVVSEYALVASRHRYEFGTTSEQLAEIKVAASLHAQYNPHALLPKPVSVEEVISSPVIADPLHRLDCCVVTDGGGAVVVVSPEIARSLPRRSVKVLGHGEAVRHSVNTGSDLTFSPAVWSGPAAFAEARLSPADVDYASIYDSFTITVLVTLEDLGFCPKGTGGSFVSGGTLVAPFGALPFNTDGGGLCSNHPAFRGGMTKVIEAVRQLRGEAQPAVQVPGCQIALAHGSGGSIATRMGAATLLLGVEDA